MPAGAQGGAVRALAVTVSNRAAAGVYEDRSGPVLARLLAEAGCSVDGPLVVPDGEPVEAARRGARRDGGARPDPRPRGGPGSRRRPPTTRRPAGRLGKRQTICDPARAAGGRAAGRCRPPATTRRARRRPRGTFRSAPPQVRRLRRAAWRGQRVTAGVLPGLVTAWRPA